MDCPQTIELSRPLSTNMGFTCSTCPILLRTSPIQQKNVPNSKFGEVWYEKWTMAWIPIRVFLAIEVLAPHKIMSKAFNQKIEIKWKPSLFCNKQWNKWLV